MALTTPLVNGNFTSYADIILRVGVAGGTTIQIVGATSIDYDDDLKRAPVYGTQTVQLGLTNGKYEAHGSITLLLNAANLLIDTLGTIGIPFGGFRYVPLTVSIAYATVGPLPTNLDSFICYLGKQDSKNKVGDEPSERTFALYINGAINWNGFLGAFDLNSTLAVA
jgi:hypothetical protein